MTTRQRASLARQGEVDKAQADRPDSFTKMEDLAEIKRLMIGAGITRLTMTSPEVSLTLVTADHIEPADADSVDACSGSAAGDPAPAGMPGAPREDGRGYVLRATRIGRFQTRYATRRQPAVMPGVRVVRGEVLGFVRDGMTLHPVVAQREGTIAEVVLSDGDVVGYGVPLFVYRP